MSRDAVVLVPAWAVRALVDPERMGYLRWNASGYQECGMCGEEHGVSDAPAGPDGFPHAPSCPVRTLQEVLAATTPDTQRLYLESHHVPLHDTSSGHGVLLSRDEPRVWGDEETE